MNGSRIHGARRSSATALRLQAVHEGRLALALVGLLTLATMSILATTNTLSRVHAEQLSIQLQR